LSGEVEEERKDRRRKEERVEEGLIESKNRREGRGVMAER
jgi:hypothetical protein